MESVVLLHFDAYSRETLIDSPLISTPVLLVSAFLSSRGILFSTSGWKFATGSVMAAVSVEEPMSEELRRDRAQRALQVAAVSGFIKACKSVQASCLGLCNACRDGVPVGSLRVAQGLPPALSAMVTADTSIPTENTVATRVLQPRRVLRMEWDFRNKEWGSGDCLSLEQMDLTKVQWPDGVKDVQLFAFNKTLEGVAWPPGLERLSFNAEEFHTPLGFAFGERHYDIGAFNHPLQGALFPCGLREIFLGGAFNQEIEEVLWPELLERLSLPGFNKPIDNVNWPPRLLSLEFQTPDQISLRKEEVVHAEDLELNLDGFNRPLTNLPATLETLWLSDAFARSLEAVSWPSGLKTLGIGGYIVGDVSWPSTLRHVYSRHEVVRASTLPPDCVVTVVRDYDTESQSIDPEDFEEYLEHELDADLHFFDGGWDGPIGDDEYCDDDCPYTGFGTEYDRYL